MFYSANGQFKKILHPKMFYSADEVLQVLTFYNADGPRKPQSILATK